MVEDAFGLGVAGSFFFRDAGVALRLAGVPSLTMISTSPPFFVFTSILSLRLMGDARAVLRAVRRGDIVELLIVPNDLWFVFRKQRHCASIGLARYHNRFWDKILS